MSEHEKKAIVPNFNVPLRMTGGDSPQEFRDSHGSREHNINVSAGTPNPMAAKPDPAAPAATATDQSGTV